MPAIVISVIEALLAAAPQIPALITAAEQAIEVLRSGNVTPEQEAAIRAALDQVKAQIDAA